MLPRIVRQTLGGNSLALRTPSVALSLWCALKAFTCGDRSMTALWTRSNADQPGRLKNLHQMPFTFGNDTRISRPQITGLVRCGFPNDSHFSGDDVYQLISIRMQLAAVWRSTGHVRKCNDEPVAQSRWPGLVLDERHT